MSRTGRGRFSSPALSADHLSGPVSPVADLREYPFFQVSRDSDESISVIIVRSGIPVQICPPHQQGGKQCDVDCRRWAPF
ncbi:hypothetical protein ACFQWF_24190 [Methylorubrum suomiense]|nr:hypothetical protein [Methylobacterium sp. L1A1]